MKTTRRGSVLAEALVAVVLMAVGMTALMQALMNSAHVVNEAQDYGRAWLLINEKLQEKIFIDKSNVADQHKAVAPFDRFEYNVGLKTLVQQPWTGLKQLDIAVVWTDGKNDRRVGLTTLLPNDNTTQTTKSIFYN